MAASKGMISAAGIVVIPIGIAAMCGVGAAYGAAAAWNTSWAIFNPMLMIIAVVAIGWLSIQTTRLAVLRHGGVAVLVAFAAAALILWAEAAGAYAAALRPLTGASPTSANSAWAYLGERRAAGVGLVAGYVTIKGWMLVCAWVAAALLVLCATLFTMTAESSRPFCRGCRSWGWKPRWKFEIKSPADGPLSALESTKSFAGLLTVRPSSGNPKKLRVRLGACDCGRLALVAADYVKLGANGESAATNLIEDLRMTSQMCGQLFDWAESINPAMAERRPRLQVANREPVAVATPIRPPDGEYVSSYRWSGSFGGGLFRADNEYTKELRQHLRDGAYATAEAAVRAQRHADDLAFVAEACADWEEPPVWLEDWATERPTSAAMHLVRGICFTKWAWVARGSGWKPRDYGTFIDRLSMADDEFESAAAAAAKDPTPWAWMVQTAKGLQLGEEEVRRRLAEADRRWPGHTPAYVLAVDALSPKWGGSVESMLAVAREAMARGKPGSNAHVAIVDAHIEAAMTRVRDMNSRAAADAYLSMPEVAQEIRRAYDLCLRPGVHVMTMATPRSRAWFAYALWKCGAKDLAAEQLRIIGKSTAYDVFNRNLPFMRDTVKRARRECGV